MTITAFTHHWVDRPATVVPGTEVEVVRWTGPGGDGACTVTWLPTEGLELGALSTKVSDVEGMRAASFTREDDRLRCLASAWLLRQVVAISLDVPPLEVPVFRRDCNRCTKPHGRPLVRAATSTGAAVHVSATHSGGLVGVALSTSGPVGIDVEDLQARGPNAWPAVWRVLGRPAEPRKTEEPGIPESASDAAWGPATAWVRTEAVLKATGSGLATSPRSVEITPGIDPEVIRWPWGDPTGRVSLFDCHPGRRGVAALAVIHEPPDAVQISRG